MKKFIALLISVVLLVPMLAIAVMAEGETTYSLLVEDAIWSVIGDGTYTLENGVLVVHSNADWPCADASYTEDQYITVNADDYSLEFDIVAEGSVNVNIFFEGGESWTISNSALGLTPDQYDANSGDLYAGTYTGKISLKDYMSSTKNMNPDIDFATACPNTLAGYKADGTITVTEINVYSIGADVDVTVNKLALVPNESKDDAPATVPETITVDGDLSDNGWAADGWTEVNPENGYWQGIPTTDTLSYRYQIRTDDTKLYVAVEIDCAQVVGVNGEGTNARLWMHTNEDSLMYTHFYDVNAQTNAAKKNTVLDGNVSAAIENTSLNGVSVAAGDKTNVEFSVDLAEFGGENGFAYYICVSNKVNENVCLYYPAVVLGADDNRGTNLPWSDWYEEGEGFVDVEALKLGEIAAGGSTPDPEPEPDPEPNLEELLKEELGEANEDAQFDLDIEAPESYEAGDEITVTVTVKNIVREAGIHAVTFNLYYDNEQLVLTNAIDEREKSLICVAEEDIPEEWEILTKVNLNEEGTEMLNDGVIYVAANTPYEDTGITEDGALVFTFTFKVADDADSDIGLVAPHAETTGGANAGNELLRFYGNGDYAVINAPADDTDTPVKPGDASNMIVFAIVAIVAIAGSAVIVKTRR